VTRDEPETMAGEALPNENAFASIGRDGCDGASGCNAAFTNRSFSALAGWRTGLHTRHRFVARRRPSTRLSDSVFEALSRVKG